MAKELTQQIRKSALELGFDLVGFTPAERLGRDEEALRRWLAEGYAGEMAYMARDPGRRADPQQVLPGARTVICLGLNYFPGEFPPKPEGQGRVSRYAWGKDYHRVIEEKLEALEARIREVVDRPVQIRRYVDYGPILERAYASRAGLGFIGKNTLLISEAFGSWVFLAELITDLELETDAAPGGTVSSAAHCGSCTLCIDACPTGAFTAPYRLDATRCISYLTIENKGEIPEALKDRMGDWAFGCDICQEVCPYNHRAPLTTHAEFGEGAGPWLDLERVLQMDAAAFRRQFEDTPLLRPKHQGLRRNAETAALNHP